MIKILKSIKVKLKLTLPCERKESFYGSQLVYSRIKLSNGSSMTDNTHDEEMTICDCQSKNNLQPTRSSAQ